MASVSGANKAHASGYLQPLLEQFLSHVLDYRSYSPATADAYGRDCRRFIAFLEASGHPLTPEAVTSQDVQLFVSDLSSRVGANSVRRALYAISSFLRYLCDDVELLNRNPAGAVRPPKRARALPHFPSEIQCCSLLQACQNPTEGAVIGLLLLAGLRRAEALSLDLTDVDLRDRSIRVKGKGDRERVVPVSADLGHLLRAHLAERTSPDAALLVNRAGNRMGATSLYRLFRRVLQCAGMERSGLTPHSLRHGFASHLLRAGVDLASIGELLGHQSLATTALYLHGTAETRRDAVEKLQFGSATTDRDRTADVPLGRAGSMTPTGLGSQTAG